jgi:lipopolysaccharide export system permease protein
MQEAQNRARFDHDAARKEFEKSLATLKKSKAMLSKDVLEANTSAPWDIGLGRLYCNGIALVAKGLAKLAPKQAKAQGVATTLGKPQGVSTIPKQQGVSTIPKQQGSPQPGIRTRPRVTSTTQTASSTPAAVLPIPVAQIRTSSSTPAQTPAPNTVSQAPANSVALAEIEAQRIRLQDSAQLMNSYGVEIHKKFALAVACFVFVLLGAPIALRFPRGGVGLTIGVSLFVFALYYVCLIAGESIAKRGMMPAVVSMWMANVIFSLVALWLLSKMGQEGSTARGGDMRDMFGAIKGSIRSRIGWKNRRIRPERIAA